MSRKECQESRKECQYQAQSWGVRLTTLHSVCAVASETAASALASGSRCIANAPSQQFQTPDTQDLGNTLNLAGDLSLKDLVTIAVVDSPAAHALRVRAGE